MSRCRAASYQRCKSKRLSPNASDLCQKIHYNLSKICVLWYTFCISRAPREAAEILALAVTDCTV